MTPCIVDIDVSATSLRWNSFVEVADGPPHSVNFAQRRDLLEMETPTVYAASLCSAGTYSLSKALHARKFGVLELICAFAEEVGETNWEQKRERTRDES